MLKPNKSTIKSNSIDNNIKGSVRVKAGSFVVDNQWVSYDSYLFRLDNYVNSVVTANRQTFFSDRGNALILLVTLSLRNGIKIIEGPQVKYTNRRSVPLPKIVDTIPLVGVIVRQDSTGDLNGGYIPMTDEDLIFFSGTGNIEDKDLVGITGIQNTTQGLTGIAGYMGITGVEGITGEIGDKGSTGYTGELIQGATGIQGSTGISWDVHLPFSTNIQ